MTVAYRRGSPRYFTAFAIAAEGAPVAGQQDAALLGYRSSRI